MIKPRLRKRGGVWHMVIEMPRDPVTGRRWQRDITTECARKKDAEAFLENYLKERMTGQKTTAPAKMTIGDLLDRCRVGGADADAEEMSDASRARRIQSGLQRTTAGAQVESIKVTVGINQHAHSPAAHCAGQHAVSITWYG